MEIAIASAINLACLSGLWYLNFTLKHEKFSLLEIEDAKVYSPSRLLSQLAKPDFLSSLKRNNDNPDEYILKAFIEGYAECPRPIKSIIDDKTQLVHSLFFRDEIYSNDSLIKALGLTLPKNETLRVRAPFFFHLVDAVKDVKCLVLRNLRVDAAFALEKVAETREYKGLNWFEKTLIYLALFFELISLGTRSRVVSRGIKIGWRENEYGVLLGSALTIYGKIFYNIKHKSLRIDRPQYFLQDKANLLKKLKGNIWKIQGKMIILAIPFLLSSVFLIIKAILFLKKWKRRRMDQRLENLWRIKFVEMKDDYKCIICFDRPRNIIVKPCLHFSLCTICYNHLEKKCCPVCKKPIKDIIEVYFT